MNEGRKEIIQITFVVIGIIFLVKLFSIQVLDERYKGMAESNAIYPEVVYPERGLIRDRNGQLIVYNTPEFDLLIIRNEVKELDSAAFCEVFSLTREQLRRKFRELRARRDYASFKPTIFLTQLSNLDFARIQDRIDEFPGFYIQPRSARAYTTKAMANAL